MDHRSRSGRYVARFVAVVLAALAIGLMVQRLRALPPPSTNISAWAHDNAIATSLFTRRSPAAPQTLRTIWHFDQPDLIAASPLVVGDFVYLTAGHDYTTGRVLALNLQSGQPVWQRPLNSLTDYAPVVAGDLLYVGTRSGELLALNRHTGEEMWAFQGRFGISGPPLVEAGVLYVGNEAVFALDAASGAQRWQRQLAGRIIAPLTYAGGALAVLAGSEFVLIDAVRGRRLLTFPLWFNPRGAPAISAAQVAFTGDRAYVQALDLSGRDRFGEGALRFWWTRLWLYGAAPKPPLPPGYAWQKRDLTGVAGQFVAADAERFYLGVEDTPTQGRIVALAGHTGNVLWERSLPSPVITAERAAIVVGDMLVVGSGQAYFGLSATTGETMWTFELPGPVLAAPSLNGDLILAPVENSGLYALEISAR